jgi:hypothetical protein
MCHPNILLCASCSVIYCTVYCGGEPTSFTPVHCGGKPPSFTPVQHRLTPDLLLLLVFGMLLLQSSQVHHSFVFHPSPFHILVIVHQSHASPHSYLFSSLCLSMSRESTFVGQPFSRTCRRIVYHYIKKKGLEPIQMFTHYKPDSSYISRH